MRGVKNGEKIEKMMILTLRKKIKNGENIEKIEKMMMLTLRKKIKNGENIERSVEKLKRKIMMIRSLGKKTARNGESIEKFVGKMMILFLSNKTLKKWRKYRKNCNDDTVSDEKGCKKWRQENGESQKERRQKRWEGPRGRHAWKSRHGMDNSDSDSIEENRPVEEIKKEINSLKEEVGVLVAKKKGLWEELVAFKTQIKTLRQNEGARDEILKLREQIFEKKRVAREYHWQITNSKNRIWKLKNALVMKVD